MTAQNMLEMLDSLFPPCNIEEKVAILEDLQKANSIEFAKVESELANYLK